MSRFRGLFLKKEQIKPFVTQLDDFASSYGLLKVLKKYTHEKFAELFLKHFSKQGILPNENAEEIQRTIILLSSFLIKNRAFNSEKNGYISKEKTLVICQNIEKPLFKRIRERVIAVRNDLVATIWLLSLKYNKIDFVKIVRQLILDDQRFWSFDSFEEICYAQEKSISFINEIFQEQFDLFAANATESSWKCFEYVKNRNSDYIKLWNTFFYEYIKVKKSSLDSKMVLELLPKAFPDKRFELVCNVWRISIEKPRCSCYIPYDKLLKEVVCCLKTLEDDSEVLIRKKNLSEDVAIAIRRIFFDMSEGEKEPGKSLKKFCEIMISEINVSAQIIRDCIFEVTEEYLASNVVTTYKGLNHLFKLMEYDVVRDAVCNVDKNLAAVAERIY